MSVVRNEVFTLNLHFTMDIIWFCRASKFEAQTESRNVSEVHTCRKSTESDKVTDRLLGYLQSAKVVKIRSPKVTDCSQPSRFTLDGWLTFAKVANYSFSPSARCSYLADTLYPLSANNDLEWFKKLEVLDANPRLLEVISKHVRL